MLFCYLYSTYINILLILLVYFAIACTLIIIVIKITLPINKTDLTQAESNYEKRKKWLWSMRLNTGPPLKSTTNLGGFYTFGLFARSRR